jgi:hypothetical protein
VFPLLPTRRRARVAVSALTAAVAGAGVLVTTSGGWIAGAGAPEGAAQLADALQERVAQPREAVPSATVNAPFQPGLGDLTGDGIGDLIARQGEQLYLHVGTGNSKQPFKSRMTVSSIGGWDTYSSVVRHGDWDGDGREDVITRFESALDLYAGTGKADLPLRGRVPIGTGVGGYAQIFGLGDVTGDRKDDLGALDRAGGLWVYPGTGLGYRPLGTRKLVTPKWGTYNRVVSTGDVNGDGASELWATTADGRMYEHQSTGDPRRPYGAAELWSTIGNEIRAAVGLGDVTGGGRPDQVVLIENQLFLLSPDYDGDSFPWHGAGWGLYDAIF